MSQDTAIRVLGIGFTARQIAILAAIAIVSLHPFVLATASSSPFFLGLPVWYYANVGVLVVIYLLIQLYVGNTGESATLGTGGEY